MNVALYLIPGLPLAGCLLVALLPRSSAQALAVPTGILAGAMSFAASLFALYYSVRGGQVRNLDVSQPWMPGLSVRFALHSDGISLPLIVLTSLLSLLCMIYSGRHRPAGGGLRAFVALQLLLETGMLATFEAYDLILFFIAFETVLLPMYVLIAVWGGTPGRPDAAERRRYAARKFLLYTVLGSGVMLVGFLGIAAAGGGSAFSAGAFDIGTLRATGAVIPRHVQDLIAIALVAGFGVKTPMWPMHTWLPDAHTEAPTVGSVLLAGVLLKMGTYGLIRIALPAVPLGMHDVAPALGVLAVAGIVWGALCCLAQRELKRMIAYSSVGHMGFVLLGIATLTPVGVNAALIGNVAHGLITGLLFFLAGGIKDRFHTDALDDLGGGLLTKAPYLGGLLGFAAVASLGLPGLAGFWGEMLAMLAAYHPADGLSRPVFLGLLGAAGAGALLTAGYFLRLLLLVNQGVVGPRWRAARLSDVSVVELASWTPLVVLTLAVGLWPRIVLGITTSAVSALLGVS